MHYYGLKKLNQNNYRNSTDIKICYWPGRESNYSRNRVLLKAMYATSLNVLDCSAAPKDLFRYFKSFLKFLRSYQKCDIVLIGFLGHFLVPIARIFTRKPIIFDSFVSIYMTMCLDRKKFNPNGILAVLAKWIDKKSCQLADIIICDTNEHIKYFTENYNIDPKKFIRLWVGSDESIMHPQSHILEKPNLIHFHGEFQSLHGIETIIAAASLIPEAHFRLIGKGETRKQCEEIVFSLKLYNVEFMDPVPYEQLPRLMSEAKICLGIFGESIKTQSVIPHKIFEALAVGRPLITADTPASRELLTHKENAYLCNTANAESLAAAIRELQSNEELRQSIAEKGHKTFQEKCSFNVLGNEIQSIIEEFMNKKPI